MKKHIKIIKGICITAAVVAAIVIILFVAKNINQKPVEVEAIAYMDTFFQEEGGYTATVSAGKSQTVLKEIGDIASINVKEGDRVEIGDVLLTYDDDTMELRLQQDRAALALVQSELAMAKERLAKYQGLKPSEEEPVIEPEYPAIVDIIDNKTKAQARGAKGEIIYYCDIDSLIKGDFLKTISKKDLNIVLNIYDENYLIANIYLNKDNTVKNPESQAFEDWKIGDSISLTKNGDFAIDLSKQSQGHLVIVEPEKYSTGAVTPLYPGLDEDYYYSESELAKLIAETEKEIRFKNIEIKEAELALEEDMKEKESGAVLASINGTVTQVSDPARVAQGDSLISIKGDDNFAVTIFVNELDMDKVNIGDEFLVMSYGIGQSFTAKVEKKESTPTKAGYFYGFNPNSSFYPVIASVEDKELELVIGDYCQASLINDDSEEKDTLYIPAMYVRSEGNEKYVMKAGENGLLEKQYVKTGACYYNYYMEIKEGLTRDDYLAFPYGSGVKEGAKVDFGDSYLPEDNQIGDVDLPIAEEVDLEEALEIDEELVGEIIK